MIHRVWFTVATAVFGFGASRAEDLLVDYVVETFDNDVALKRLDVEAGQGAVQLLIATENTPYGKGFLQIKCSELRRGLTIEAIRQETYSLDSVSLAKTVSFWYNIESTHQLSFELSFSIFDSTWCNTESCSEQRSLERWETMVTVVTSEGGWAKASFSLDKILWKRADGFNDGVLELRSVKGWSISINLGATVFNGRIQVDHVAYHGDADMVGAWLLSGSWAEATVNSIIQRNVFDSSISGKPISQVLDSSGSLYIDYLVQQSALWGGILAYWVDAPTGAYFNLSRAESISFDYHALKSAFVPSRVHLRLLLADQSDCSICHHDTDFGHYYSSHYVLDASSRISSQTRNVQLIGDKDTESPFTLADREGEAGNRLLDKSWVNGFGFEISVKSQGTLVSQLRGSIRLRVHLDVSAGVEFPFVSEPDIILLTQNDSSLKHLEFKSFDECKQECMAFANCNFAFSSLFGSDCYHAESLDPSSIELKAASRPRDSAEMVWKDTEANRGDFCTVCSCIEESLLIDCRGKKLILAPKTFKAKWNPVILDLRDNPELLVLGRNSLLALHSLVELRVSKDLLFLSPEIMGSVELERIELGTNSNRGNSGLINVITTESPQFGSVCCSKGRKRTFESQTLTWCNMELDSPGIDCAFKNFTQYRGDSLDRITPSSSFLSEASQTPEKCAEVCNMRQGCNYFSFDNRLGRAHPICWHYSDIESSATQCCRPEDYSDAEQKVPGLVAGYVAKLRSMVDGARVFVEPGSHMTIDQANNFREYIRVSLGAMPTRGAVWIVPVVPGNLERVPLVFEPATIALYDNVTTASILVSGVASEIENMFDVQTYLITLDIVACDKAFRSSSPDHPMVSIRIVPPRRRFWLASSAFDSVLFALFGSACGLALFFYWKRKRVNIIWGISLQELEFDSPQIILGRGTFGVVTKAVYRGTQVAVKRALPVERTFVPGSRQSGQLNSHFVPHQQSLRESEPQVAVGLLTMKGHMMHISSFRRLDETSPIEPRRRAYWDHIFKFDNLSAGALRASFIKEMRLLSALRHPCITTVLGAVIDERANETLLVMEYMAHGSLHDVLHNETIILESEKILPILLDVVSGLRYLHSCKPQLLHCDLKASNILVDKDLKAKVADVGLSHKRVLGASGTPYFMAPELLRCESTNTPQSDVFSFGIVLYEVFSRKDPYEGEDFSFVIEQIADPIVNKRPPVPEDCPELIEEMMIACLEADASKRPSFGVLQDKLKLLRPEDISANLMSRRDGVEALLADIFPPCIARALKEGRQVETENWDMVTILFSDIVGFTEISSQLAPDKVANMLNRLYLKFDDLSRRFAVFKVETIGDSWMGVTNLIEKQSDHVKRTACMGHAMIKAASETLIDEDQVELGFITIRIGLHSGPVSSDVVGSRNPRFCLFGDTVNIASRMESHSLPGRIHCSEASAVLLRGQEESASMEARGEVSVKGKGTMYTYWINEIPSCDL